MAPRKSKKEESGEKRITLTFEHNPYDVGIFAPKKYNGTTIIFPVFNYQGDKQYVDLINRVVEEGYKLISINLLNRGDRVLFFNYYYDVFEELLEDLHFKNFISGKDTLVVMGIGIGANLASYMNFYKNDDIKISKIILISPVNRYKSDYRISREVINFNTPTYIFYGQFDTVSDVKTRFSIFQNGKDNPNVHFSCYPVTGHYLYYSGRISMELEKVYQSSNFDLLVGESRKNKNPFLPSEAELNQPFFEHLFNILKGTPNPKRIALLIDVFPLFINGVDMVVSLLKKELDKLGYETYIVALWKKDTDFALLPSDHHIPVIASYAKMVKGHKDLDMLSTFSFSNNAKMLALFGFDYLHLHTEYSMSKIAIELSKITGIKMPYTYHTLWRMYYENKFGKLIGDITFKAAKEICFKDVYKECPVLIVPSAKSYEILQTESNGKDIRIIPSPVNAERFQLSKEDRIEVANLKTKYKLKGKKVLGYVGRVSTEKNITETINYISQIVSEIPNLIFMIVGVGDATESLKKYAKKMNVEKHIIYVGQVPNTELKLYYSLFDVFVTASNFETQGLTYFEAATVGTLILAKEDKAIENVFVDGVNAYTYTDFYSWVDRIEKALFGDRKPLIDAAKSTMKQYSQDKWAKKMLAIYQELNDKK